MSEQQLDRRQIVSALAKSPHGQLTEYVAIGRRAAYEDPEFFGRLVAWNHRHGQVKDAKVALPVIALATATDDELRDNALAHLAALGPREFARAVLPQRVYTETVNPKTKKPQRSIVRDAQGRITLTPEFYKAAGVSTRLMRRLVHRYLRDLEKDASSWTRTAVQHRKMLHSLYSHWHAPIGTEYAQAVLYGHRSVFGGAKVTLPLPDGSVFAAIRDLATGSPEEIAGTILRRQIPFLIAAGTLGKKATDPDVVVALIKQMSQTELVTNMKWLEKVGVKTVPALRAALEQRMEQLKQKPKAAATLKTTRAADAIGDDALADKLRDLQEVQIDKLGGVDGNWLVLGDASGSMQHSIELARQVAGTLARMVKGQVRLVFFSVTPTAYDVTGKSYDEIVKLTQRVRAGGGTSIGCGLQWALDVGFEADGIAVVSDGGENQNPYFAHVYQQYQKKFDREPTVYLYLCPGDSNNWRSDNVTGYQMYAPQRNGIDVQTFDLVNNRDVDYYSLPNLVKTMRTARYGLIDEIMNVPLRTLDQVLTRTIGMDVLIRQAVTA